MILTKITSAVLALTFGVGFNLADIDLAAKEAAAQAKAASKYLDFEPADFTSYELTTFRGDKITVSVDGKDFCVDCDCSDDIILGLYDAENFDLITKSDVHTEGTFSEDFTGDMEENVLYMINVSYVLEGVVIDAYSNYVILLRRGDRILQDPQLRLQSRFHGGTLDRRCVSARAYQASERCRKR